jgi:hypothetical protein
MLIGKPKSPQSRPGNAVPKIFWATNNATELRNEGHTVLKSSPVMCWRSDLPQINPYDESNYTKSGIF